MDAFGGDQKHPRVMHNNVSLSIYRNPPQVEWFLINRDGVVSQRNSFAACGGVIRDCEGAFIAGFANKLGQSSVVGAELWGILRGIKLGLQLNLSKVVPETDSVQALHYIENGFLITHSDFSIVQQIKEKSAYS
ncbi:Ribonuclease H-like superfamily [Sesbania bispinosa]|nr:Ribonuclease H-like superfamily [Sesbania bispinosa]